MKFTEATVKAFKIPDGKADHFEWDATLPGFGFRCRTAGGSKVYLVKYRVGAKQRKLTLGATNKVTLEAARANAKLLFAKVAMKIDPADERAVAVAKASDTFNPIIDGYIAFLAERVAAGTRTQKHLDTTSRFLKNNFRPLHGFTLPAIKLVTVSTELKRIVKENGKSASNRARAALSSFFNWSIGEGLTEFNPVSHSHRSDEVSRKRVLGDDELRAIWQALPENGYGRICKLLILTAQRRDEIGALQVSEINWQDRQLELPGRRTKNGEPHTVPLSDEALAILSDINMEGRKWVFGRHLSGPFSGYSKSKIELDAKLNVEPWVMHDFRRAGATSMGEQGVLPHIVEAVLNHISGAKKGVAGTYNKALYLPQKREALYVLAAHVMKVVA